MTLNASDLSHIHRLLNRPPSEVECTIFDTMWSEHCSYKSSKDLLKKYLPTQGSEVLLGIGEDSGIIRLTTHNGITYGVVVSHESHNHPSQILPIEGAATGVGGVVRDVYCMGADVIGVLNSLHFGINTGANPLVEDIATDVVKGISDYANALGVPVLGGETLYHTCYNDNCLVNVAALGLVEADKIIHSFVPKEAKDQPFDIILLGKSTDSTGFGGATFSSATLDKENDHLNIGAVQIHDPFLKRVLIEALKAMWALIWKKKIPVGFKDLGAGGIACASSELASASGFGVTIDLDNVNLSIPSLSPEIIACSETQERFCLAVPRSFTQEVLRLFNHTFALPSLYPNAGAVVIGHVTHDPSFILRFCGKTVCNLPISAITTEVRAPKLSQSRPILREAPDASILLSENDLQSICLAILKSPNVCSKRYIYRFFDNAVRGDTVFYPGESDAVVITPIEGCPVGVSASIASNVYGTYDPYMSGAYSVAESIRNILCIGARPLCITDCLNYGNPENPSVFFDFEEGIKGIAAAANAFGFIDGEPLPVISGNVSFYNDSKQAAAIVPSPVIVAVGKLDNYKKAIPQQVFDQKLTFVVIGERKSQFGGTQVATLYPGLNACAPQVDFVLEKLSHQVVYTCIQHNWVVACHDISAGGLWTTICEMILGERCLYRVGATLVIPNYMNAFSTLFSENGGFVLAVQSHHLQDVIRALEEKNLFYIALGQTSPLPHLTIKQHDKTLLSIDISSIKDQWNHQNQL